MAWKLSISRYAATSRHSTRHQGVVEKSKTIVGYFGALAKWFDYEFVISLARRTLNTKFC